MLNIRYSNKAETDLFDAIDYIAQESKTNAINYLFRYEENIELLRLNPFIGTECKNKLIQRDCRVLIFESHLIIYKVNKDKNEIFIIRIFHGSEDYKTKI